VGGSGLHPGKDFIQVRSDELRKVRGCPRLLLVTNGQHPRTCVRWSGHESYVIQEGPDYLPIRAVEDLIRTTHPETGGTAHHVLVS
jgi:hypothetical protein